MADTSTATDKKSALSPPEPDSFQPWHSTDHASSDDDDWFNKSLDEFEVPTASHRDDRWSDEDEDEEEKTSESNQLAQGEPQTARAHDTKEANDSEQDVVKKEKRVVVLSPVGVTFALLPATSKHFKVMLDRPWSVPKSVRPDESDKEGNDGNEKDSSVKEEDTRTEPTKRDESKDTAVEEDTRTEPTKRDESKDTAVEEDTRTEPTKRDESKDTAVEEDTRTEPTKRDKGKDTAVEEDTGAGPMKRDKGKDTAVEEDTRTEPTKRDKGKDTAVEEDTRTEPTKRDKGKDTAVEEDTRTEPTKRDKGKDTAVEEDTRTEPTKRDKGKDTAVEEDTRTEPTKRDKGKDTAVEEDTRTEPTKRDKGKDTAVEEDTRTEPTKRDKGKDTAVEEDTRTEPTKRDKGKDTAVEEDTGAGPMKRDKGKDTEGVEEDTRTEPTKRDKGKDTAVEEDTGAGPMKRDKGKDTEGVEEDTRTEPTKRDKGKDTAVEEDTGAGPMKRDKGKDTAVEEDTRTEPTKRDESKDTAVEEDTRTEPTKRDKGKDTAVEEDTGAGPMKRDKGKDTAVEEDTRTEPTKRDESKDTAVEEDTRTEPTKRDKGKDTAVEEDTRTEPTKRDKGKDTAVEEDTRTEPTKRDKGKDTAVEEDTRTEPTKRDKGKDTAVEEDTRTEPTKRDKGKDTAVEEDTRTEPTKRDKGKDTAVEEDTRTEPTKRDKGKDTAVEEDTRTEPTKRDKGKDTAVEEDTRTEPTKRDKGKDTAVEEDTRTEPTKRDKGKDTAVEEDTRTEPTKRDESKDTAVEEDTRTEPTKRDKGKDTAVEEDTKTEPVNAEKDTEGSNKEEDEGDEIQKEEVCGNAAEAFEKLGDYKEEKTDLDEDKDEEWFQTQLKELPTMFNHPGVHSLSEAKLRKNQTMLRYALQDDESDSSDGEEDLLKDDIYSDSNLDLLVVLLRTDSGDFSFVEEILVKRTRTEHEQKEGKTKTLSRLFPRNHENACFLVVITWLLGRSPDAETQARRLALQYPYSFVAVANLFYILWKKGDKADAVAILRPLLQLKKKKPDVYQAVLMEDLGEIVVCFTEMGPKFIPYILELLETILPHRPHWNQGKWHCALNLRRLTNAKHTWTNPMTDVVTPLLKATNILIDMLQGSLTRSSGKALVAAELGDILHSCVFDEKLQDTVGKRAHDAGLDAAKCFDIVMQEEDDRGSNLVRAGKYFRYKGQLKKSEEALKKAVAVQDSAKVHHQLALTLKKMAMEEYRRAWQEARSQWGRRGGLLSRCSGRPRRGVGREGIGSISRSRILAGDSLMAGMERSMKSQITYFSLSREDPHVKETMHHLNKALMLSHGENCAASYDLALMYKVLGEHSDALQQFLTIIEIDEHPSYVVCAYEQSGLMLLEKSSQEETDDRARKLQEDARSLLAMALLVQSNIVCQFRHEHDDHNQSIWQSFHSLGQYLHLEQLQQPVIICAEQSPVEVWLLRLLRVYADTVPVLLSIQQITHHDATDPHAVQSKVSKYLRDQRYQDTALFISLLRLTDQWPVLRSALQDMMVRAQVLAASAKLTADTKAGQMSPTFNSSMAKRFFCWTFEDMHPHTPGSYLQGAPPGDMLENSASGSCESSVEQVAVESDSAKSCRSPYTESSSIAGHQGDGTHQADGQRKQKTDTLQADRQKKGNKGKLSVSQVVAKRETLRKSETGSGDHELEDVESEVVSLKYHVLLVHDSEDSDAAAAALAVQGVLQNTCGLRTQLSKDSSPAARRKATLQAMGQAHLILFVVGSKEISPELKTYLAQAASRLQDQPSSATNQSAGIQASEVPRNILTLTLDNTPILSLPTLLQAHPSFPWPSKTDSRSMLCKADFVCKLFCFLTGADEKF